MVQPSRDCTQLSHRRVTGADDLIDHRRQIRLVQVGSEIEQQSRPAGNTHSILQRAHVEGSDARRLPEQHAIGFVDVNRVREAQVDP